MKTVLHTAASRGHMNIGWLDANYSFSFGRYYDPERIHFGALRVFNDDIIRGGTGFGTHPHDNMEIVTIPLSGALEHKDSTGGQGVIRKYDVQVMSAGTGVEHSEFNHSKTEDANTLQIWVLPAKMNVTPRYDQKTFLPEDRENRLQTLVAPDNSAPLKLNQDTWFSLGNFAKGQQTSYRLHQPGNGVYAFVIEGGAIVGDLQLEKRDAAGIWDTDSVDIRVTADSELLLIEVPMLKLS